MTTSARSLDANPYVGPRALQSGEAIYGRDREVTQLLDRVVPGRVVLMYSPSGAGKTSLIQAGLVQLLEEAEFTVRPVIRVGRPVTDPSRLGEYNRYVLSTLTSLEPELSIERQQELAGGSLRTYLDGLPDGGTEFEFLIFDQFEELLLLDPTDRQAKEAFVAEVGDALRDRRRWTLFAMREDRIAGLDPYLHLLPTRLESRYRLDFLTRQAARAAVQGPARARGVTFTDGAAEELIDNLARVQVQTPAGPEPKRGEYVEPVQLQVVCRRLWDLRNTPDVIDVADVRDAGDVDRALGDYYEEKIAEVVGDTGIDEQALRVWFDEQLITTQGFRSQVPHGPDAGAGVDGEAIARRLDPYLVRSEPQRGTNWWELTHDRLIEPVRTRNATWHDLNQGLLERQARQWNDTNRGQGYLLRGDLLREAERQKDLKAGRVTSVEREFLDASRELADRDERTTRQRNRWLSVLALGLAVMLVIAVAATLVAIQQSRRASQQRSVATARSLAVQANLLRDSQPVTARLLATAALSIDPGSRTSADLVTTLLGNPYASSLIGHTDIVKAVAFGPDGRVALTGSRDGTAILWDIANRVRPSRLSTLPGSDGVSAVALSADGDIALTGSFDNTATLWDIADPRNPLSLAPLRGHTDPVTSVAVSSDGHIALTGSFDNTATLWDIADPRNPLSLAPLRGHTDPVTSVALSSDGHTALTGSYDGTAILWDLTDPEDPSELSKLEGPEDIVNAVALSADGHTALTGSNDGVAIVWDLSHPNSPARIGPLAGHSDDVMAVALSADGHTAITGSRDGKAILWNLADPERITTTAILSGHTGMVTSVALSPDVSGALTGSTDNSAILWHSTGPAPIRPLDTLIGHTGVVKAAVFSPNGRAVLTGGGMDAAFLWDVSDPTDVDDVGTMTELTQAVFAVAYSPNGRLVLTGGENNRVILWNVADPTLPSRVGSLVGLTDKATSIALSPDGRNVVVSSEDNTALQWDITDPTNPLPRGNLTGHADRVSAVVVGPDGHTALTGSWDKTAIVWDLADPTDPRQLTILRGHTGKVFDLAVSPDGLTAITGSEDRTAILWDISNRAVPRRLATLVHAGAVLSVAFSPNGQWVLTGSPNGSATLWSVSDPAFVSKLVTLTGHVGAVYDVAFSPNGRLAVTASEDHTAVLWDLAQLTEIVSHPLNYACSLAGRGLNPDEWSRYVLGIPYRNTCPD